ncbi:MAG: NAD-binding protein, partial [Anaerolineaceae bacterium]|nr:NAD-binding protein [Anaerolineaceae bacterium]
GRLGIELAYRLYQGGHDVSVIDAVSAAFNNLPPDFQGRTIEGDALSQDVLHRAGIETADALAAVTNQDALNGVVAHIARTVYEVANVAVRNYDPRTRTLLEAFDVQIVSSTAWGAQRIEEILYHEGVHSVYSAGNGEVEFYEFIVPPSWDGKKIADVLVVGESIPSALTSAGRAILPKPGTILHEGDVVHFSATIEGISTMRNRLSATMEA